MKEPPRLNGSQKIIWWIVASLWTITLLFASRLMINTRNDVDGVTEIAIENKVRNAIQDESINALKASMIRIEDKLDLVLQRKYGLTKLQPNES